MAEPSQLDEGLIARSTGDDGTAIVLPRDNRFEQSSLQAYSVPIGQLLLKELSERNILDMHDKRRLLGNKARAYLEHVVGNHDGILDFNLHSRCHGLSDPEQFKCFHVLGEELDTIDRILTKRIEILLLVPQASTPSYISFGDDDQLLKLEEESSNDCDVEQRLSRGFNIWCLLGQYEEYPSQADIASGDSKRLAARFGPVKFPSLRYSHVATWYDSGKTIEDIKNDLQPIKKVP